MPSVTDDVRPYLGRPFHRAPTRSRWESSSTTCGRRVLVEKGLVGIVAALGGDDRTLNAYLPGRIVGGQRQRFVFTHSLRHSPPPWLALCLGCASIPGESELRQAGLPLRAISVALYWRHNGWPVFRRRHISE